MIELTPSQEYQLKVNIEQGEENCTVTGRIEFEIVMRNVESDIDALVIAKTAEVRISGWTVNNAVITVQKIELDEVEFDDESNDDEFED